VAIIISDIHGKKEAAQAFLAYKPDEEHVCLGDIIDSRGKMITLAEERACLSLMLESSTICLWGNHELAYLPERPWPCYGNFGVAAFEEQLNAARSRFLAAYAVDGWLCTHAGVSPKLARRISPEVIAAGSEAIATWLNEEFIRELASSDCNGPLFKIPMCRGGTDEYGGIFWFDAEGEQTQPARQVGRQIFGHTPVPTPERGKSWDLSGGGGEPVPWINLDARKGHWVYDTKTDELVELFGHK